MFVLNADQIINFEYLPEATKTDHINTFKVSFNPIRKVQTKPFRIDVDLSAKTIRGHIFLFGVMKRQCKTNTISQVNKEESYLSLYRNIYLCYDMFCMYPRQHLDLTQLDVKISYMTQFYILYWKITFSMKCCASYFSMKGHCCSAVGTGYCYSEVGQFQFPVRPCRLK